MSVDLILKAVPATLRKGPYGTIARVYEPEHVLNSAVVAIATIADAEATAARFGQAVHHVFPDRSFAIIARIREGHAKPAGFDPAQRRGLFGRDRWLRFVEEALT